MEFTDRTQAGRRLARHLDHLRRESPVVVGIPRGGVLVAAEVATHLGAPLDIVLVRKLGVPDHPELAMGAIGRLARPHLPLEGRTVIVVDDGVATGWTATAACHAVREAGAARVVLAVPVAPPGWASATGGVADEYVAIGSPDTFVTVGQFYREFDEVADDEVLECLASVGQAERTSA